METVNRGQSVLKGRLCRVSQAVVEDLELIDINEQYSKLETLVPLGKRKYVSHAL